MISVITIYREQGDNYAALFDHLMSSKKQNHPAGIPVNQVFNGLGTKGHIIELSAGEDEIKLVIEHERP